MGKEEFDRDYFERGIASGKSLYENYRWIPELTIPMAMTYIDTLGLKKEDRILDFGCAKGYVVKALRMLHRKAWGCDVSDYAIESSDQEIGRYLKLCNGRIIPFRRRFEWIIAKDVLEHIKETELENTLLELRRRGDNMLAIIPLGESGRFIVPAYHLDKTHTLIKGEEWWAKWFIQVGWEIREFKYRIEGIKDNWADYPKGNGFFKLK